MGQLSTAALVGELRRCGEEAGLAAVGVAPATPMEETRRILEERKAAGLSANMQFTYRNPARSTDPRRVLAGAAALVVGAWPYGGQAAVRSTRGGRPKGAVARYASRDHYADLEGALSKLADLLKRAGWQARVVFDDNALVDRAAAERAGIGWFGKNSNVLLPGLGSWFLLGSVVTDAPLPVGTPVEEGCGPCTRCLGSCPTGALVAPGVLDARRCLAWLLQAPGVFPFEYRAALGGRIYGCDDCQDVCPANRLAARLAASEGNSEQSPKADEAEVDLLEMLASSSPALLARHGRWYIPERDPRYLRRNALIALGNVGDGQSPDVQATLERYLDGPDDLLRAHAIWAAIAAGRRDLVTSRPTLGEDPSPLVRYELDRS
ncbi:MAG TPA: tRNA epoxyqueuosine(34) reductase QueG [Acidimicrobiales bacterium]|nr:tRNA epoxyqueuosine(34) reductase QueG [Acidimicrobiales bacterium]